MKGSRRKKDRPVSSVRRPAYRAEFAPAECCGSGPAMRIELPLGELTGDLQGAVHGLVGQLRAPWRPPIAEEVEQRAGRRYEHQAGREVQRPP